MTPKERHEMAKTAAGPAPSDQDQYHNWVVDRGAIERAIELLERFGFVITRVGGTDL